MRKLDVSLGDCKTTPVVTLLGQEMPSYLYPVLVTRMGIWAAPIPAAWQTALPVTAVMAAGHHALHDLLPFQEKVLVSLLEARLRLREMYIKLRRALPAPPDVQFPIRPLKGVRRCQLQVSGVAVV